ncbi:acyl-CoA-like ligand-binding transcription factor [Leucobacter tenebrionis]|uniref:acyl-CoA-like ligand-binding transcription factor n=1 Tax=Leucobacter tenebrionis TaxID=2873270 RepID=UPI001CA7A9F0|nr:TetR family transcriptional regulator [Leucobacter tenebrionis]QZY53533.1 TetR family transcriptional regulator [Leucobacter tenebrionis]
MFTDHGFENTTVAQIAREAGITERTYFRYYNSKAALLGSLFESQKRSLQAELDTAPSGLPMMDALRHAVIAGIQYPELDNPEQRMLVNLLASEPALNAVATDYLAAWEHIISEFAGKRLGQPATSLYCVVVGRTTLAACRAAFEEWAAHPDDTLASYLDSALIALARGFGSSSTT